MSKIRQALMMAAAFGFVPSVALAADDFIEGVYLKSTALCAEAKKNTLKPLIDAGQMALSTRGFDTAQSDCAFVQVLKHPRTPRAWVVTAYCQEPGFVSPDVFTLVERKPGQVDVASLAEGNNAGLGSEDGGDAGAEESTPDADGTTAPGPDANADPAADFAYSGISGTYFHCDGVALP